MIGRWTPSITAVSTKPWVRSAALTLYYQAIPIDLIPLCGKGDFSTSTLIYQGF